MTQQAPERKTIKGNIYLKEVWITHHDTDWGPHIEGASLKSWAKEYNAPITEYADNTRFVNEAEFQQMREALADLVSWFDTPSRWGPWIIDAGEYGADAAVEAARAALKAAEGE